MWQTAFFDRAKSPPTREKHEWLREAFHAWLRSSPAGARTVLDGFAGAGSFAASPDAGPDDALGSPLLLLRWSEALANPVRFVFAEKSRVNHARLREVVGAAARGRDVEVRHETFAACAKAVLPLVPPGSGALFSFVDPYGCDGVSFATLRDLASRGDLLFHLATHQVHAKLVTVSGESPRQARRMDALLGGVVPWSELRARGRDLSLAAALALVPAVLVDGLRRDVSGLSARIIALRDGRSHLIHAQRAGRP
jgi:three-Cys-motif partner protein